MMKRRGGALAALAVLLCVGVIGAGTGTFRCCASTAIDNAAEISEGTRGFIKSVRGLELGGVADETGTTGSRRLSQKLTVTDVNGLVPVSGTVKKVRDDFYPGTYEIRFSRNTVLGYAAEVEACIDVKKGNKVYILTGNKESGYREYAEAVASEDGVVTFETGILQDYTVSTTDIKSAQIVLAALDSYSIN